MEGAMEDQLRGNNEDVYTVKWRDFRISAHTNMTAAQMLKHARLKAFSISCTCLLPKLYCKRGNPSSSQSIHCKYRARNDGERSTDTTIFLAVCCQQLIQNFSSSCFYHFKRRRKNPFPSSLPNTNCSQNRTDRE